MQPVTMAGIAVTSPMSHTKYEKRSRAEIAPCDIAPTNVEVILRALFVRKRLEDKENKLLLKAPASFFHLLTTDKYILVFYRDNSISSGVSVQVARETQILSV